MTVKEMQEKRQELSARIHRLADLISDEKRDFTEAEQKEWGAINAQYDATARIQDLELDEEARSPEEEARVNRMHMSFHGGVESRSANGQHPNGQQRQAAAERWIDPATGDEVRSYVHGDGRSAREHFAERADEDERSLTLGGLVRTWLTGKGNEAEKRALAGGTDAAGGFTVPSLVAAEFLDRLRESATVLRAGARVFPFSGTDSMTVARLNTPPTLTWAAEGATVAPESAMDIAGTTFVPKTVRTTIRASREVLEDSVNLDALVAQTIAREFGRELDRVALVGSGSGAEPKGLRTQTGVTQLDLSAALTAADPYNEIVDMREDILDALGPDPADGGTCIMHQRESTKLHTTVTSGVRIGKPTIFDDVRFLISQHIAIDEGPGNDESAMFLASREGWANLMIGMRMPLFRLTLVERYSEEFQIGFLAAMRMDIAMGNAAAIGRLIGIIG